MHRRCLILFAVFTATLTPVALCAEKPLKIFILAGQSNMVGYGDSKQLPDDLRSGKPRVLMFEDGKWQPLKPFKPAAAGQRSLGLTEFTFGPEIAFGQEIGKAWPNETIGIIKYSIGGTSLLAWKPNWSKEDADRVGQGKRGSLYKKLMEKIAEAKKGREIEIVGLLWLQGGGDMEKEDVAKEYLANLKAFVAAVRKDLGIADLPFLYGSPRNSDTGFVVPDDLSNIVPKLMDGGPYPAAQWVLKAQFDAQKEIPHCKMVLLRDIERHPQNVHYNTAGQLKVGKMFAEAFLEYVGKSER